MSELKELTDQVVSFRDERAWAQFHKPKDVVISLMLEAAELAEHFQWKSDTEISSYLETNKEALGDELADVLYWVLLLSHDFGISLREAFLAKLEKNRLKYPIDKAKGKHDKYSTFS